MEKLRWPGNNGSDEYLFCVVHINNRALTTSSFFLFALGIRNLRSNKILYVPWKTGIASSFSFSFLKVSDMFVYKKEKMGEELLLLIAIVCLLASIVDCRAMSDDSCKRHIWKGNLQRASSFFHWEYFFRI